MMITLIKLPKLPLAIICLLYVRMFPCFLKTRQQHFIILWQKLCSPLSVHALISRWLLLFFQPACESPWTTTGKLVRLIRYLRGTIDLFLTFHVDPTNIGKWWWVDGSYAVHPNMHLQSGRCLSLGHGMAITASLKQKLNTRSSTEMELIAVDDFMSTILWTNYFLSTKEWQPIKQQAHKTY